MKIRKLIGTFLMLALLVTAGCGGGGGGGAAAPASTVVSGVVSKGAVGGATVTVFAITNGVKGVQLGQTTTVATGAGKGAYTVDIGGYTGPVLVEVTGGTYVDEASNTTKDLVGLTLRAVVANAAGPVSAAVTPLTEIAAQRMNGNYQASSITEANDAVAQLFGVDNIITTQPVDSNSAAAASAPLNVQNYALALATVSQYMETSGKLLSASMADFASAINPATPAVTADQVFFDLVTARTTAMADATVNNTGITGVVNAATTATLRLSTRGTLPPGTTISGVGLSLILPAGVTVNADALTNEIDAADLTISGVAAGVGTPLKAGSFTPAVTNTSPGKVKFGIATIPVGFGTGEFVSLRCNVAAGSVMTASNFVLADLVVNDPAGNAITGLKAEFALSFP